MNVSVVDLSETQKKLHVTIPSGKVREELDQKYRDLARQVKIKGFRPGKVPRSILKSYYGKAIEGELSSKFIQESFPLALRDSDLKPLAEADVSDMKFEEDGAFSYTAVVDVSPPFVVEDYKGIGVHRPLPEVTEEQEQLEIERLREQHSQLRTLELPRPIQEGDIVMVDFTPWVDGAVFEKGKNEGYLLQVGKGIVHPDLDPHLISHLVGDSLSVDLDYPTEGPVPEIAGKTVHMDIVIKDLKEKIVPELDDDFAREVGKYDTLDDLKQALREQILKREEEKIESSIRKQIIGYLLKHVSFELPEKILDMEAEGLVANLQHQLESQGLKLEPGRLNTPEIRADYRPQAEENLRQRLILSQIAKQEQIELSETEEESILRDVARMTRMDLEAVRQHADSALVAQIRENRIHEKVFALLKETAAYSDTPVVEEA